MSILRLSEICKSYGEEKVLDSLSLSVQAGEIVALMGASGSGKTTALQIAGLLDRPDGGEIFFGKGEKATAKLSSKKINNLLLQMGFIYQFHHLLPEFTVMENLVIPQRVRGYDSKKAQAHAQQLLDQVGLGHKADEFPGHLSGGEAQRIAVVRAFVNRPLIVFADEPTGSLDSENAQKVFTLMDDLRKSEGTAILMVTHDLEIGRRADRKLQLKNGKIKE
jgi:lipoprotein-releasing system ATP-binding protein